MRHFRKSIVGAFFLVCLAIAQVAGAQVSILAQPGTVHGSVLLQGQFNDAPYTTLSLYTVPSNRFLRITDMVFTNYRNAFCDVAFSGKTYEIRIPPNQSIMLNWLNGPSFGPGETVVLVSTWRLPGWDSSCRPIYTIRGYLFTVP